MKKLIPIMAVLMSLIFLLPGAGSAATASATLTGPGTVRAGNTITLTFNLNGSNIYGCEGSLSYDSSQVTLTGTRTRISSPWTFHFANNRFVLEDTRQEKPINSRTAMFTATFKVNGSLPTGTRITISASGKASDGKTEANVNASYSATLAAPLSSNANLRSLTVSNATISPSFSTNTTSYSTTVPFSVSSLNISTATEDSAARVSISGNSLRVGRNAVSIRVTAASGATKTYTINVTRQQDPDYVASENADLESITIDKGILSPLFETDRTDYIVYLPFEVTSFTASGVPADSKALDVTEETKELLIGENLFTVTVMAENGSTRDYLITVVRMPEYGSEPEPEIEEPEPEEPEEEEVEPEPEEEEEEEEANNPAYRTSIWMLLSVLVVGLCLGYGGCYLLISRGM